MDKFKGEKMKYTVGFMNPVFDLDFTWRTFDTIEEDQKFIEQMKKLGYETGWE